MQTYIKHISGIASPQESLISIQYSLLVAKMVSKSQPPVSLYLPLSQYGQISHQYASEMGSGRVNVLASPLWWSKLSVSPSEVHTYPTTTVYNAITPQINLWDLRISLALGAMSKVLQKSTKLQYILLSCVLPSSIIIDCENVIPK